MKILGDSIFARTPEGALKSRIGTIFFRTPALVTQRGIHAMQRIAYLKSLDAERSAAGQPPLTEEERSEEIANSVDLIFTDDTVLIRPDPNRMDLAFQADEELQKLVSKRRIRFLNTHSAKVRDALRQRGENWRMARAPLTPEDIVNTIESAHVAIDNRCVYYYNSRTGTRFLTIGGYNEVAALPADAFRAQVVEVVKGLKARNRLAEPEIRLFPVSLPPAITEAFKAIDPDKLGDSELRVAVDAVLTQWRVALPPELREESVNNFDWRNEMSFTLTRGSNETEVGDQDLIEGISPEFYRQIEWLPGGRVVDGRLIFDTVFDEAQQTDDPSLAEFCDFRVRSILFNLLRLFGNIEFVNIGRIARSLARHPVSGQRRGNVYIVQCKESHKATSQVYMVRFQKWGVAEHLDEGKDLLTSIQESNDYADYILDRRLACRQLGMALPERVGFGQFTEKYAGKNQYAGITVRANYYVRSYIPGVASDKVPPKRFGNPAFAQAFAWLMGEAAALDLVVGRAATETGECLFDTNYEVIRCGEDGLPVKLQVTDQAGTFVKYLETYESLVGGYANAMCRREKFVKDYEMFKRVYVTAFERALAKVQADYRANRAAYDELFLHRPYDTAGSCAYRWSRILARLDACDPKAVAAALTREIEK